MQSFSQLSMQLHQQLVCRTPKPLLSFSRSGLRVPHSEGTSRVKHSSSNLYDKDIFHQWEISLLLEGKGLHSFWCLHTKMNAILEYLSGQQYYRAHTVFFQQHSSNIIFHSRKECSAQKLFHRVRKNWFYSFCKTHVLLCHFKGFTISLNIHCKAAVTI